MVCGNRRHPIVPFETRVSYCPIRIEKKVCRYFPTHFLPARASASGLPKAYGIPGLRSPTIIWKHLCVVYATHRSQRVADRHRPVTDHMGTTLKLPFVQILDSCFIPNNNSALHEDEFVRRAIEEILT